MKKIIAIFVLITLLIAIPVQAQDNAQLSEKLAALEEKAAQLQLIAAGTTPVIDPAIVHQMNEAIPTTIGLIQITRAYVTADDVIQFTFKLINTLEEPVDFEHSRLTVRDADGVQMETSWKCPNRLDGMLIPGDMMLGNVCFKFSGPLPIRVYYTIDSYNADFIIWEISE